MKDQIEKLREESGREESTDPLISFLYELMRDHVPCGVVEGLMTNCDNSRCIFTNGYLARYAKNVAKRLRGNKEVDHDIKIS
jgi:hypothetical protein